MYICEEYEMKITLDFKNINSKEELHCYLQQQLQLPDSYGNNLDALHDCLSERQDKYCVRVEHLVHLRSILGSYADTLLQVFRDTGNSVIDIDI